MPVELANKLLDGDEINEGYVNELLDEYIDWLEEDTVTNRCIIWAQNSDHSIPRGNLYHSFGGWCSHNVDDNWFMVVRGIGSNKLRNLLEERYENDDPFRQRINDNIVVVGERNAKIGTYNEVYGKDEDEEEEGDEEVKQYGKVQEAGIVNGDLEVDVSKLRGAALKFAQDVDKIKGTEPGVNRDDLRAAFNRWMLDRLGNDWTKFISEKFDPGDLMDVILFMYKKNEDFEELVHEKYEYDPEELEGNGSGTKRSLEKKKQQITNYNDESINPKQEAYNNDSDDEESGEEGEGDLVEDALEDEDEPSGDDVDPINISGRDIINGDCTDVVTRMEGRIGAVITDPPYGLGYDSRGEEHDVIMGDDDLGKALEMTEEVLKKARLVLREGSPIVVFAGKTNLPGVMRIVDKWYDLQDVNVWNKEWVGTSQIGGTPVKWRPQHEYAVLGLYGDARVENENRHDGNVWSFQRKGGDNMDHPTEKPVELLRYIIESLTEEGDVVFDPFAGSGSTLVAAKQADRGYFGVEMDEEYYELIQDRLDQGTLTSWT